MGRREVPVLGRPAPVKRPEVGEELMWVRENIKEHGLQIRTVMWVSDVSEDGKHITFEIVGSYYFLDNA